LDGAAAAAAAQAMLGIWEKQGRMCVCPHTEHNNEKISNKTSKKVPLFQREVDTTHTRLKVTNVYRGTQDGWMNGWVALLLFFFLVSSRFRFKGWKETRKKK
jgi:hypothetical protein